VGPHSTDGPTLARADSTSGRLVSASVRAQAGVNDLSQAIPKPLVDEVVRTADVVITMGCGDACPTYPSKRYVDWTVDDPAGQPIERVRQIRDVVHDRVVNLLAELNVPLRA
jgi:protein-tyrosine-phosphatase